MIKIIVRVTLVPGSAEAFKVIAAELVAGTREEEGCIAYQLFQDKKNPDLFFFVEEWASNDALEAHRKAKHYIDGAAKLKDLLAKGIEANFCTLVV